MSKYTDQDLLTASTATFQMPVYVGHWKVGGNLHFSVTKRPRWLTRVMMKWLLEWEWKELKASEPDQP